MWTTPTTNDVLSEFTASEAATIQNIQGAGSSNLQAVLTRVIDKIRGSIQAAGKPLDQTSSTSIPKSLVDDAIAIARWRLLTSTPTLSSMKSDARKDAYEKAIAKIDSIAAGKIGVEPPDSSTAAGPMIEEAQAGDSGNSREELSSL